jgi:hypothetical protein
VAFPFDRELQQEYAARFAEHLVWNGQVACYLEERDFPDTGYLQKTLIWPGGYRGKSAHQ